VRASLILLVAGAAIASGCKQEEHRKPPPPAVPPDVACRGLDPEPTSAAFGRLPQHAFQLRARTLDGQSFDLARLRGRVVLVNLTATWLPPDMQERTLASLAKALGDDLAVLRVTSALTPADIVGVVGPDAPVQATFDQGTEDEVLGPITRTWGVRAVPESFLVDRAGRVRFYIVNARDWSTPDAIGCLKALVAEPAPTTPAAPGDYLDPPPPPSVGIHPQGAPPPPPAPSPAPPPGDHHVAGTVTVDPKLASNVQGKVTLYVVVKHADASGEPTGTPIAVTRLEFDGHPLAFRLSDADAMIGGETITGPVVVIARLDHDGDVITKQPGDLSGAVHGTAPADGLQLVLDTAVP
jgi:hypothetical protein